jgi:hypothetical protein
MKHYEKYTTNNRERKVFAIAVAAVLAVVIVALSVTLCHGEEELVTVWAMCKPGSQVNVRRTPSKKGQEVGYLDAGDSFLTDGTSKNGFIRCYGIGEYGEGWVYAGYVATEEPDNVMEQYVCVSNARVACRRWMNGPKVDRSPWLSNGSNVIVFSIADGWACTSRGYIRAEYLEVDPR